MATRTKPTTSYVSKSFHSSNNGGMTPSATTLLLLLFLVIYVLQQRWHDGLYAEELKYQSILLRREKIRITTTINIYYDAGIKTTTTTTTTTTKTKTKTKTRTPKIATSSARQIKLTYLYLSRMIYTLPMPLTLCVPLIRVILTRNQQPPIIY